MKRVTAAFAGLLLIASPLLAQEPVTDEREHVVREGDTLWDLAGFYFSNPFQWPTIYDANPLVVEDPHWIYPQEVLVIPGVPGIAGDREAPPRVAVRPDPRVPLRTVFYRPPPPPAQSDQPTVLSEPGLTTFPVKPGEFSSAPYLMNPRELEVRAYFMRPIRQESPTGMTSAHPQDRVYLSYADGVRPEVNERLVVVDVEEGIAGAAGGSRVIHPKAIVRIISLNSDVMEGQIEAQFGAIYPDRQRLVPVDMFPDFQVEEAEPVAEGYDLQGRILDFMSERPMYGRAALAFINLGRQDGVREGDVFQAYLPVRAVRERVPGEFIGQRATLPQEEVAELRVVRVTDRYATVKVDEVQLPRLDGDMPVRRIRRIP